MKTLFLFDLRSYFRRWGFCLMLLFMAALAFFAGQSARFSVSDDVFHDAPYQLSFVIAFISLVTLFFSTVFASQLLLKEFDNRFELLLFSTPVSKKGYIFGRYFSLLFLTFLCVTLFTVFFISGQLSQPGISKSGVFSLMNYLFPLFFFTFINTFFTTAFISLVGWLSKNRMMVFVSGLLLYILYMLALVYSSSPFMAQSLPQSDQAKWISALADPFGLSAFFYQTSEWTVIQRNAELVPLNGMFVLNRFLVVGLSCLLLFICVRKFNFTGKAFFKKAAKAEIAAADSVLQYHPVPTSHNRKAQFIALFSYVKITLIYVFKSIPFVLTLLILLFAIGMEMQAEIEKGIRIPQKYATSGLMTTTIIQNFYFIALIVVLYYAHDLFWRSRNANFNLIEDTTANTQYGFWAQWISLSAVILIFSATLIIEGILFQIMYGYALIEWTVYANVLMFNSLPLILLCGFVLLIQKMLNRKYPALVLAALFTFIMATPFGKNIIVFPLLRFLNILSLDYSEMNGFGTYSGLFLERYLFGFLILAILFILFYLTKRNSSKWKFMLILSVLSIVSFGLGSHILEGYNFKNQETELKSQTAYEKTFRKYQNLPQPTVTDISTTISLFPDQGRYTINGVYIIENKTATAIDKILVNFAEGFVINYAFYQNGNEKISLKEPTQLIAIRNKLLPHQKAVFRFDISYQWQAVNGHQSFNSIIANGSFMRVSRYYPSFGYDAGNEIQQDYLRKQFQLPDKTRGQPFDTPKSPNTDFINLKMIVTTNPDQVAIGVGELKRQWKANNRNCFLYQTDAPIPFRFAVSSAKYSVKKELYKGRLFEIYYAPKHSENVDHLLKNAKVTLDYCETNFGLYPFKTIRFAEVSGFTKGFAATAYPATIYMTEDMIFHSNIKADRQQDVINELAGHELSHLWWGNSQISPDNRDGAAMLTETLAMYTEMMLVKKMYGKAKMQERLKMHEQIYNSEKGFGDNEALYKVKNENAHISYSKGAVVMCKLADLLGEEKVNAALRNFLEKNKFPNDKPISNDLIEAFYKVSDAQQRAMITEWFKK